MWVCTLTMVTQVHRKNLWSIGPKFWPIFAVKLVLLGLNGLYFWFEVNLKSIYGSDAPLNLTFLSYLKRDSSSVRLLFQCVGPFIVFVWKVGWYFKGVQPLEPISAPVLPQPFEQVILNAACAMIHYSLFTFRTNKSMLTIPMRKSLKNG